jgi:putative peptidoglycan lipid II flippase
MWLAVMSRPLVALLYEHGHFHAIDTEKTAAALVMYCLGLPAFAAVGVMTRTFYALGDTKKPVQASFVSVALNLGLNLALMRPLGHLGLALSTSATACANLLQLGFYLRRRIGPLGARRMVDTLVRVLIASAIPTALCGAGLWLLGDRWHAGTVREALVVGVSLPLAIAITYGAMKALRVAEVSAAEDIARTLGRRLIGR